MADYDANLDMLPEFVGFMLATLDHEKDGRGAVAKWAQDRLSAMVALGYITPTVHWKVWDARAGAYTEETYATKDLALGARRELGGNSARYRVERVSIDQAVTE